MLGLKLFNTGNWNKPPVLAAARLMISERLGALYDRCPLGQMAEFVNGTSYDTGMVAEHGAPIIRISNITKPSDSYLRTTQRFPDRFHVATGDLLVSWSASFKTIIWPGPDGILNQHIFKVNENPGTHRGYIRHAIEAAFEEMQENVVGMGMMHLRRRDFIGHSVPKPPYEIQEAVSDYLDWVEAGCREVIPDLPASLSEQRRIVAKIESLAAKLGEARHLREGVLNDARALLGSVFAQLVDGADYQLMSEVAPIVRRRVEIEANGEYPELGVRSFGKGTFHKPVLNGIEVGSKRLFSIHEGDLVLSNVFAWEGAIAVATADDHQRVGSHRFITCAARDEVATAQFLRFYLLTQEGMEQVRAASPGGAGRNRTLGLKKLEKIQIPVIDYDKQLEFDRLQAQVAAIRRAQANNQTKLDALLPAILDRAFSGGL